MIRKILQSFITQFKNTNSKQIIVLGRWQTNKKKEHCDRLADWATEDNCGCCYGLTKPYINIRKI